jgi:transposase
LGVGLSTLCEWVSVFRPADLVAAQQVDLARENERLRLQNLVLKEERNILKKATQFFASQRPWGSLSWRAVDIASKWRRCAG